jgi:hypothetical protein
MTESSKDTKAPTPTKRIEMDSRFEDTTKSGTHEIFIGAGGMKPKPKPDEAPAKP